MRPLVATIHEFTQAILNPYDLQELLSRLMDHATDVVGAAGAGIMLEGRSELLAFAAASNDKVSEVERLQDVAHTGACHEAFMTNKTVVVDDLHLDERWPSYRSRALELGLEAVIGVPLNAHGQTIGVLNVYRDAPTPWTEEDVQACELLAAMGAGYILHANQLRASQQLAEQLQEALDSRAIIECAKGILMAQRGLDADTAFRSLRQASMDGNRKLRDLAREVVDGFVLP